MKKNLFLLIFAAFISISLPSCFLFSAECLAGSDPQYRVIKCDPEPVAPWPATKRQRTRAKIGKIYNNRGLNGFLCDKLYSSRGPNSSGGDCVPLAKAALDLLGFLPLQSVTWVNPQELLIISDWYTVLNNRYKIQARINQSVPKTIKQSDLELDVIHEKIDQHKNWQLVTQDQKIANTIKDIIVNHAILYVGLAITN